MKTFNEAWSEYKAIMADLLAGADQKRLERSHDPSFVREVQLDRARKILRGDANLLALVLDSANRKGGHPPFVQNAHGITPALQKLDDALNRATKTAKEENLRAELDAAFREFQQRRARK